MTRAKRVPDRVGNHGEQQGSNRPSTACLHPIAAGQAWSKP